MNKKETYGYALAQIRGIVEDESDLISDLANVCAILRENLQFFWVGFYLVKNDILSLGPFQGPVACTRIPKGKGVCGQSWERAEAIVVDDVHSFPGHIACSSLSNSEIVVPLFGKSGKVMGVLDVDSKEFSAFDLEDKMALEEVNAVLTGKHG